LEKFRGWVSGPPPSAPVPVLPPPSTVWQGTMAGGFVSDRGVIKWGEHRGPLTSPIPKRLSDQANPAQSPVNAGHELASCSQ